MIGTRDSIGDGTRECDIDSLPGAVAIHGGEKDLTGAKRNHFARVAERIETGWVTSAVGEDFPSIGFAGARHLLGIDCHHDALIPEFFRGFLHERPPCHGRGVDGYLVGARGQELADIPERRTPPPTVSGMKQASAVRRTTSKMMSRFPRLAVISRKVSSSAPAASYAMAALDGIAGIAQVDKFHALDDLAVLHVKTGNNADLEHRRYAARAARMSPKAFPASSLPS